MSNDIKSQQVDDEKEAFLKNATREQFLEKNIKNSNENIREIQTPSGKTKIKVCEIRTYKNGVVKSRLKKIETKNRK